jgi:lipopolysaccharide biosynthesis protein
VQDVCLFAHFDKDDKVDDYVLWYISTSRLAATDVERLGGICSDVILRENAGLDFGSWSEGLAKHVSDIHGRLLLANDSVYGPIGNLPGMLDRLTSRPADFYGPIESNEIASHVPSWFLLFEPWVVHHPAFREVMAQPFHTMTKTQIIQHGEIMLSRRLIQAGFHYQAVYMIDRAGIIARLVPFNSMQLLWRELLFDEGIPFLKIELLRDNPLGVEDPSEILRAIEPLDPRLCRVIKSHLARSSKRVRLNGSPETNITRWAFHLRQRLRRLRYKLSRRGYHLHREHRPAAEIWNFLCLLVAWQPPHALKDLLLHLSRRGSSPEPSAR